MHLGSSIGLPRSFVSARSPELISSLSGFRGSVESNSLTRTRLPSSLCHHVWSRLRHGNLKKLIGSGDESDRDFGVDDLMLDGYGVFHGVG